MDKVELQKRNQQARDFVERAHTSLRETPLQAIFPEGIRKDILLGTRFRITHLNYQTNTVTFSLG